MGGWACCVERSSEQGGLAWPGLAWPGPAVEAGRRWRAWGVTPAACWLHALPEAPPPASPPCPALQPPVMRVLLLAPLNLAALYLAELDETKLSAGVGLAASAALLLGAQQAAIKAGRNLI